MRIVLDTNVMARAVSSPGGPAGELFERISADHVLVTSVELLAELARVLTYDRVRQMHGLGDAEINEFIGSLESGAAIVRLPEPLPRVVLHDPDDDRLVATAVAGQANVLCTLDRHLRHADVVTYCRTHAIEVLDDLETLHLLRRNEREPDRP